MTASNNDVRPVWEVKLQLRRNKHKMPTQKDLIWIISQITIYIRNYESLKQVLEGSPDSFSPRGQKTRGGEASPQPLDTILLSRGSSR